MSRTEPELLNLSLGCSAPERTSLPCRHGDSCLQWLKRLHGGRHGVGTWFEASKGSQAFNHTCTCLHAEKHEYRSQREVLSIAGEQVCSARCPGFLPSLRFFERASWLPAMDTGPRATIRVGISMAAFLLGCARSQGVASPRHHPGGSEGLWVLGKPQDRAASAVEAILGV